MTPGICGVFALPAFWSGAIATRELCMDESRQWHGQAIARLQKLRDMAERGVLERDAPELREWIARK